MNQSCWSYIKHTRSKNSPKWRSWFFSLWIPEHWSGIMWDVVWTLTTPMTSCWRTLALRLINNVTYSLPDWQGWYAQVVCQRKPRRCYCAVEPTSCQYPVIEHTSYQYPVIEHTSYQYPVIKHTSYQYLVIEHTSCQYRVIEHTSCQYPVIEHTLYQYLATERASYQYPVTERASY